MRIIAAFFTLMCCFSCAWPADERASDEHFRTLARSGIDDLLRNFWTGDADTGHIANTWHGYTTALPDARGALWERATMYIALDNAGQALGDPSFVQRLKSDWQRTKSLYTPAQLEACGEKSHTNWALDDAGWSALMYLAANRVTHDPEALNRARGIVNNAFDRWLDGELGGGMWYRDEHKTKSLYQVAIVLAALRLSELTGDRTFYTRALQCHAWIEAHLLRPDGLYWCDADASGPVGAKRPNDIGEAGSVVFLGGDMAMAVLHARLFHLTHDDAYRLKAVRTADAILKRLVTDKDVFINDRDAWTNGVFACDWSREVLTLPGMNPRHRAVLQATADSIYRSARTTDGFYGGSWFGPVEGFASRWFVKNSKPQQLMTSASTVNMMLAAACLASIPAEATSPIPPVNAAK